MAGGFAVAAAVVLVLAAFATGRGPRAGSWVVAATDLRAGVTLTTSDLRTTSFALGTGPTSAAAFASPADLVGRSLAVPVGAGQLVLTGELSGTGTAVALRPVPLSPPGADLVDLASGDLVDVLVTDGTPARTAIVVRGARVLSTSQPSSGLLGSGGNPVVTVGVTDLTEVEALVAAEHAGTIDLVVGAPSDGTGLGPAAATGG